MTFYEGSELIESLLSLIAEDKVEQAVDILSEFLREQDSDLLDQVIQLRGTLNKINRDRRLGFLGNSEENEGRARVRYSVLEIAREFESSKKEKESTIPSELLSREFYTSKAVFISYSHKDQAWMARLRNSLQKEGVNVALDEISMQLGDRISSKLDSLIRESHFTVSIVSRNSLISAWVGKESIESLLLERFEHSDKRYVPVVIDESIMQDSFYLQAIQDIDKAIDDLNSLTRKALELNVATELYTQKRGRLLELRNNLDKILLRINEYLSGDFSSEEKFKENFPRLLKLIDFPR